MLPDFKKKLKTLFINTKIDFIKTLFCIFQMHIKSF